ncbi:MAG TPA: tetratricopeptide repeat protein [Terriglobia bacterium]|nr:tetratricopeptide repeat protein [Terriglobia bacterium]
MFPAHVVLVLALLQATPSANPNNSVILQDIQAGKYREAREKIQQATKKAPQDVGLWRQLGEVDVRLQDTDGAIAALQTVRSLTPRDAGVYFNLGVLFVQKGAPVEALKMYSQGLALDPRNEEANRNYAFLLLQGGKSCDAVEPLERLKGMKGGDLSVRASLIESLLKCGNEQAGKRELGEFLQLPSATVEDRMKLAKVLAKDHYLEAAEETLENVAGNAPGFAEAHADLGLLLLQKNQFEDAARQLGRAVQLEPSSARYSMDLAQVLLKAKQYPTALEFLKGAKDRFGTLPEYAYKLAWAHYGLGDVPQAVAQLEPLVQQHPELDLAHYSLGNCYVALGRLPEAETRYREAIALNPKNGSYHSALGQVLRKKGPDGVDEAILELEKARQLKPADLDTRVQLAICYEQKAALPEAARLLEATVQERPSLAEAHRVLARVYYRQGKKEQGDRESAIVLKLDTERDARGRPPMGNSSAPQNF